MIKKLSFTFTACLMGFLALGLLPSDPIAVARACNEDRYHLRYNKVQDEDGNWVTCHGAWRDSYTYENCYRFAIDDALPNNMGPELYPGNISNLQIPYNYEVYDIANLVLNDLQTLGYETHLTDRIPENLGINTHLIAVRVGTGDYHFMRYSIQDDCWYQKFVESAPLRYESVMDNEVPWISEISSAGVELEWTYRYTGTILYIEYWNPDTFVERTILINSDDIVNLTTLYLNESDELSYLCQDCGMVGYFYSLEYISYLELALTETFFRNIINIEMCIDVVATNLNSCALYDSSYVYLENCYIDNSVLSISHFERMLEVDDCFFLVPLFDEGYMSFSISDIYFKVTCLVSV